MFLNCFDRKTVKSDSNLGHANDSLVSDIKNWISDSVIFAWQFIWHPKTLGTPFICSPFVAKEILKYVHPKENEPAHNYLEVGSGTGAMTGHLIKKLRPIDTLHLVEIDKKLCEILKSKFGQLSNVYIHQQAIQDWVPPTARKFDAIISTVPLNSLPSSEVLKNIFDTYLRLIKPKGIISSVEYVGTSTLCQFTSFGEANRKFNALFDLKNEFFKKYSFERPIVLANIPPARVTHCKISTSNLY